MDSFDYNTSVNLVAFPYRDIGGRSYKVARASGSLKWRWAVGLQPCTDPPAARHFEPLELPSMCSTNLQNPQASLQRIHINLFAVSIASSVCLVSVLNLQLVHTSRPSVQGRHRPALIQLRALIAAKSTVSAGRAYTGPFILPAT